MQEVHYMQVTMIEPGKQSCYCPTCGRLFILTYPPNFSIEVVEEGNTNVTHAGGHNMEGLNLEMMLPDAEQADLEPFSKWANKNKDLFD